MKSIKNLPNLGPKSADMLKVVGIKTEEDLRKIGAIQAFIRVRDAGLHPSLNLLYAMDGALSGIKWNQLSLQRRMELDYKVNFKA